MESATENSTEQEVSKVSLLTASYRLVKLWLIIIAIAPFIPIVMYGFKAREKVPADLAYAYLPVFLMSCAVFLLLRGMFAVVSSPENREKLEGPWPWTIALFHWGLTAMFAFFSIRLFGVI
jgi:hypothetical protein